MQIVTISQCPRKGFRITRHLNIEAVPWSNCKLSRSSSMINGYQWSIIADTNMYNNITTIIIINYNIVLLVKQLLLMVSNIGTSYYQSIFMGKHSLWQWLEWFLSSYVDYFAGSRLRGDEEPCKCIYSLVKCWASQPSHFVPGNNWGQPPLIMINTQLCWVLNLRVFVTLRLSTAKWLLLLSPVSKWRKATWIISAG